MVYCVPQNLSTGHKQNLRNILYGANDTKTSKNHFDIINEFMALSKRFSLTCSHRNTNTFILIIQYKNT